MPYPERENPPYEQYSGVTGPPVRSYEVQWRYLGDRAAADAAYCIRFGVVQAPDPSSMPGSVWSYAIPVVEPKR